MRNSLPKAVMLEDRGCLRRWMIEWPSTPFKQGKSYRVTTYPDSDVIYVETAAKRRPVSATVGSRIIPQIKDALINVGAWKPKDPT